MQVCKVRILTTPQNESEHVYIVNVIFPYTKFLDLLEIKITLIFKNILNLFCLVKDLHNIGYTFHPDRDTSCLTSHIQDLKDFLNKSKSSLF